MTGVEEHVEMTSTQCCPASTGDFLGRVEAMDFGRAALGTRIGDNGGQAEACSSLTRFQQEISA